MEEVNQNNNELIKKQILDFVPITEKEEMDKASFLRFIDTHSDILTRDNVIGHITASGFVVNEDFDKTLLVKHNILGKYIFPGGHADGEYDLLNVAIREVMEETGIDVVPYQTEAICIDIGGVPGHIKKGRYVSEHLHFDLVYLLIAKNEDMGKIHKLETENSDVKWVNLEETYDENVADFARLVNESIVNRIKNLKNI